MFWFNAQYNPTHAAIAANSVHNWNQRKEKSDATEMRPDTT